MKWFAKKTDAQESVLGEVPEERSIPPLRKPNPMRGKGPVIGAAVLGIALVGFVVWHQRHRQEQAAKVAKAEADENAKKQAKAPPADFKWSDVDKMLSKPKPKADAASAPASAPAIAVTKTTEPQGKVGKGAAKPEKSEEEKWRDRRLTKAIVVQSGGSSDTGDRGDGHGDMRRAGDLGGGSAPGQRADDLGDRLRPTAMVQASAQVLPDRNFLLTKGMLGDCVMETRLVSSVSGMLRCVQSRDLWSDNGKVLLAEAGSTWTGQYRGLDMKPGVKRLFVLWDRAKTPQGVVFYANSPGTDPLGGSGLEGEIDTHFWERFGSAILISLIDDFASAATQQEPVSGGEGGNTIVTFPNTQSAGQRMAEKALEATVNIPPTLYKHHGDPIGIYLARDIDFSSVYGLKLTQASAR